MTLVYILLGILVLLVIWMVAAYNSLVQARNRVKEAWSDINVQLKRRYNLIPNLVESVKGYMKHEKTVLENVTKARNQAMQAGTIEEQQKADNFLSSTLKTLFAVAENYPDLKANANFLDLQRELTDTENKIQAARRFYNSVVQEYKNKIEMFPSNIMASMFNFKPEPFFKLKSTQEAEPVRIDFTGEKKTQDPKAQKTKEDGSKN